LSQHDVPNKWKVSVRASNSIIGLASADDGGVNNGVVMMMVVSIMVW
jgi:hypothetical protein